MRHFERYNEIDKNDDDDDDYGLEIKFIKPINLEKLLLLDSNSFVALQIFNSVDFSCAYRQTNLINSNTFRTALHNKKINLNTITLYGLFVNKMQTKIGISKLRSFLLKPTRDMSILSERHKVIEAFIDNQNQELTAQLKKCLKKCKFITSILKKTKIARIKWNEWKRLYNTTKSLLDVYEICLKFDELIINNNKKAAGSNTVSFLSNSNGFLPRNSTFISGTQILNSQPSLFDNNSNDNLFARIKASNYGPKLEYLIALFETSIDFDESNRKNAISILPNISKELDEQKRIFEQFPLILTEVAKKEMDKYRMLTSYSCEYLPNQGFFLLIDMKQVLNKSSMSRASSIYDQSSSFMSQSSSIKLAEREKYEKLKTEIEATTDLTYVFKNKENFYFKNERMIELAEKYGDISAIIRNLEFEIVDQIQDEYMKNSHIFANVIDLVAELDTLLAFAYLAYERDYVKPELHLNNNISESESFLEIREARHPLAEVFLSGNNYISNDIISGLFFLFFFFLLY